MPVRMVRGTRVSTPAVNLLNENPTLVALGKKSEKAYHRSIYDFPLCPRADDDIFLQKIITFSPENLKTLIKVCGFPIFFRLFPP